MKKSKKITDNVMVAEPELVVAEEVKENENTSVVSTKDFDKNQMVKINKLSKDLAVKDANSISNYAVDVQTKLSNYSTEILKHVRNIDTGEIGEVITDLLKDLNIIEIENESNGFFRFLKSLPLIKNFINATKNALVKYDKINNSLDNITLKLDKGRLSLIKDSNMLDVMYKNNIEYIRDLDLYIAAAGIKIEEIEQSIEQYKIDNKYDEFELKNTQDFVGRLKKKMLDLQLTREVTIQSLPQIKIIQGNNHLMVDKIQSTILNTIPLWRNHVSLSVALDKQRRLVEIEKGVKDTTKNILLKNSENLKTNSIEIARLNEDTIIDIETIKKVNEDLITTLDEIIRIKEEGDVKRKQITEELKQVEEDIKNKIIDIKQLTSAAK